MPYKIIFSENASAQLDALDNKTKIRIVKRLRIVAETPQLFFKSLTGRKELKLRVGDYRLIAMITHNEGTVFIIAIGHRKNVYKGG